MSLVRTSPPAVEPLVLIDTPSEQHNIKNHLRISGSTDDKDLIAMIVGARTWMEDWLGRALITQTWVKRMDAFPPAILLDRPPLLTVTSILYDDGNGDEQTLDTAEYDTDIYSSPGTIIPAYNASWPITRAFRNVVRVTYTAGYGPAATNIPMPLIAALKLLVGHMYENREDSVAVNLRRIPMGVMELIWSYRMDF